MNYSDDKLDARFFSVSAAQRGSELHDFASNAIRLNQNLPDAQLTINMYVNDAIGFRLSPEVALFYSDNCFGTADAIGFRSNKLQIFDLKTGIVHASEAQLLIYAALFCLEYKFNPFDIEIELRIYQRDECRIYDANGDEVMHVMEKIKSFDRRINELRAELES